MADDTRKTVEIGDSVEAFLGTLAVERRRAEALQMVEMMQRITGHPPKMWGPTIIGFDSYHYRYESGREGDALMVGFSPRKAALTIYVMPGFADYQDHLSKLGHPKTGASCLYLKRLDKVDIAVLEDLVSASYAEMQRRYPTA